MFDRQPNEPDRYQSARDDASRSPGAPYAWGTAGSRSSVAGAAVAPRENFLTMSFVWMFLALLLSAGAAGFVMVNQPALQFVIRNFMVLLIAELAFVFVISLGINRIGAIPALAMLFVYAILNGATISIAVLGSVRSTGSASGVLTAFLGASAIFGAAALYGVVTRRDLTRLGGILFMGLVGLVVVSLLNAFVFRGGALSFAIGVVGVVIFTGLTAYDVQRLRNGELGWVGTREGASVIGALHLYLDFVNLFLSLLRIFGFNRD